MKMIGISGALAVMTALGADAAVTDRLTKPQAAEKPKPTRVAIMCFGKGEQISGMNKICYYDCLGSTVAINVAVTDLCPLTINR